MPVKNKLLLIAVIQLQILSGCSNSSSTNYSEGNDTSFIENPVKEKELVFTVNLDPQRPIATRMFTLNVDVKNIGNAPTEDYKLTIYFRPAGDINTFFSCTMLEEKKSIQPGESINLYSNDRRAVNTEGNYELVIRLDMSDGEVVEKIFPFTGLPAPPLVFN